MAGKTDSVYWDSSIFLALLKGEEHRPGELEAIRKQANSFDEGNLDICTSVMTRVEVFTGKLSQDQKDRFEAMATRSNFTWVDVSPPVADLATALRNQFASYKDDGTFEKVWTPPDAIHIASAVSVGVPTLLTLDSEGNSKQKELAMTAHSEDLMNQHGIRVMRPDTKWQQGELDVKAE